MLINIYIFLLAISFQAKTQALFDNFDFVIKDRLSNGISLDQFTDIDVKQAYENRYLLARSKMRQKLRPDKGNFAAKRKIHEKIGLEKSNLTISIVSPCHYKHFYLLEKLLDAYNNQTILPHEYIISISEYDKLDQISLDHLMKKIYKFPVKYILNKEVFYAGGNRNLASEQAVGDVIIYQDVDDFPYKNRVEVVKYFFSNFDIDHLMHSYNFSSLSKDILKNRFSKDIFADIDLIEDYKNSYSFFDEFKMIWNHRLHNGNIAIKREIFKKHKWLNTMPDNDFEYNSRIFNKNRTIFVLYPLIEYRNNLSVSI